MIRIYPGRANGKTRMWIDYQKKGLMGIMDRLLKGDETFRYQLLSRLKTDCDYYLGNGNRNPDNLWGESERGQIDAMKALWNSFIYEDKPEWLTWEDILEYERKMCGGENALPSL